MQCDTKAENTNIGAGSEYLSKDAPLFTQANQQTNKRNQKTIDRILMLSVFVGLVQED